MDTGSQKTVGGAAGVSWVKNRSCGSGDPKRVRSVERIVVRRSNIDTQDGVLAGVYSIPVVGVVEVASVGR